MILPRREDVFHKIQLYRLLSGVLDSNLLAKSVFFKGGTAASMLGFLDRFSLDLDFDMKKGAPVKKIDNELIRIFQNLTLEVDKKSSRTLFYLLKYSSRPRLRNSIKLSLIDSQFKSNEYKPFYLAEIDRIAFCQTVETMFGNKLVAMTNRYKKNKTIAGRDLYDIHYFFLKGFQYNKNIIEERTGLKVKTYLEKLILFIDKNINEKVIGEDLNFLLPAENFKKIKKILKKETIMLLEDEIQRLSH